MSEELLDYPDKPSKSVREQVNTVGQLIEILKTFDPEDHVMITKNDWSGAAMITGVLDNADWGNDNDMAIIEFSDIPYNSNEQ